MQEVKADNKRIAKNTIALYVRMFFVMAIGLYTSRIILKTLGVEDYGIYNVVGGFVAMLAYLNKIFVDATQRFLSFTLGENNQQKLKLVFSTSITVHLIISIVILLIGETFGLWFVNEKLVIASERMYAANWVYQCSLLSLIVTVLSVPYKASVVAHEEMHIYAYFGIVEAILKLIIVYLLLVSDYDKLIVYAILHLLVSLIIPIWNILFCKRHFEECSLKLHIDGRLFKEMFSYSVWTLIGSLGFSFKDQFSNIIMNLFLGTTINAARGIATQVNGIVMSFAENFTTALSPQITKQYAAHDYGQSNQLATAGARYSCYLMSIVVIPLVINIDEVLKIWLHEVPQYSNVFIIITLIASVFYAMSKTLTTLLGATGDIKCFQVGVSLIMLSELPIAYIFLKLGYPPFYALLPAIVTNILGIFFRLILVKHQVPDFKARRYVCDAFFRPIALMVIAFVSCYLINTLFSKSFLSFLISTGISIVIILLIVYSMGINKNEREVIHRFICSRIIK